MPLTSAQAVERALRQLAKEVGRERATVLRSTLSVIASDALLLASKRVAEGNGYHGLQMDFAVTPAAGLVDLAALTGILFDANRSRVRVAATNASIQTIDSYETLENGGLSSDRPYVAQDGGELRFRSTTPSLTDYVTPVKIKANYVMSFTEATRPVPPQQEDAVVATMVEMALKIDTPTIAVGEAKETAETARA